MRHPIPESRLDELPTEGTHVEFQGAGDCQFFSFVMKEPWWVFWNIRERHITFRCHPGRRPIDRFNIFWVYERKEFVSRWARFSYAEPADKERIADWLRAKYWLYPTQGFPVEESWLNCLSLHLARAAIVDDDLKGKSVKYRLDEEGVPYAMEGDI